MKKIIAISLVCLIAACSNTPRTQWVERKVTISEAVSKARLGQTGHLKKIVDGKKAKADESGEFADYIDYHYWRNAALGSLKRLIDEFVNSGDKELAKKLAYEALSISPDEIRVKNILRSLEAKKSKIKTIAMSLSPSSYAAALINQSFIQNSLSVYSSKVYDEGNSSLLDFSYKNTRQSKNLYEKLTEDTKEYKKITTSGTVSNLLEGISKDGVRIIYHPSAEDVAASQKKVYKYENKMDILMMVAKKNNVNFLLFKDRIFVFKGRAIPSDIGGEQNRVMSFRSSYQPINSVVTSVRAMGYDKNIRNVDNESNTVWLKGMLGELLNAMTTISMFDVPKAQIKLTMEIVEIQSSLVTELGAKIPDFVNFEIASRFRDAGTGGATLNSFRHESLKDVLRAVSTDPVLSLAAKEENYAIDLIEKPVLRLEDGGQAEINVGDRIPVITSTANSTGFVSERVSYIDTGVKLNVVARLKNDGRVHLDLKIEASHLTKTVESNNGSSAPQLGSRKINSTMILRDGETTMLGGLSFLRNIDLKKGLPGVANINFVGAMLGGNHQDNSYKSDLMVFVTPEIIEQSMLPSRHIFHTNGILE